MMATRADFAAYIEDQMGGVAQGIGCRKMFGEYGLYCNGIFFALICDNALYIKPTEVGQKMLTARGELLLAPPYQGAKDHLLIQTVEDADFLRDLTIATVSELPPTKPKKPRSTTGSAKAARAKGTA